MKKLLTIILLAASNCLAQGPVLTPIGTQGDSWRYSIAVTPFSGQVSHAYEWCYQNPKQIDSTWKATNFIQIGETGVSGCATSIIWYYGIQPGAKIWYWEYRAPHPYQMGTFFYIQYELISQDRTNWYRSNVLTVPEVPGCGGKGKGKGKNK